MKSQWVSNPCDSGEPKQLPSGVYELHPVTLERFASDVGREEGIPVNACNVAFSRSSAADQHGAVFNIAPVEAQDDLPPILAEYGPGLMSGTDCR